MKFNILPLKNGTDLIASLQFCVNIGMIGFFVNLEKLCTAFLKFMKLERERDLAKSQKVENAHGKVENAHPNDQER